MNCENCKKHGKCEREIIEEEHPDFLTMPCLNFKPKNLSGENGEYIDKELIEKWWIELIEQMKKQNQPKKDE